MGRGIVEAPLSMADLAGNLLSVLSMRGMLHTRDGIFLAALTGSQHQCVVANLEIARQRGRASRLPIMTAGAGQGRGLVVTAVLMAVNTDQASLLMDIRGQVVGFHTVRPGRRFAGSIRSSIFPVEIVLISAIVIIAHIVAVVATQALLVGGGNKGVGLQFSTLEGEVAGAATPAVGNGGIIITRRIDMAA